MCEANKTDSSWAVKGRLLRKTTGNNRGVVHPLSRAGRASRYGSTICGNPEAEESRSCAHRIHWRRDGRRLGQFRNSGSRLEGG